MSQQPEQPSKVESWTYPFPLQRTNSPSTPETYLAALAAAQDGFYPIGANGLWHGGIHFGAETAARFNQDGGVKCIADGEVVAFRLDSELQRLSYPGGIKAGYSKGFTLVRHRLVLPPVPTQPAGPNGPSPAAPAPAPQNATPPAQDILTFFSLYMHTLPQKGYDADPAAQQGHAKTLPAYYGTDDVYSIGTSASDPRLGADGHPDHSTLGLRVRSSPSAHGNPVGWLARGTNVRIGQRHGAWGQIASVVTGNLSSYKEGDTLSANAASGWIFLAQAHHESQPLAVDKVYVLPKPRRIRTGETVAYLGEYQRFAEARAHHTLPPQLGERPLLHVEVFTGDDLAQYISRSRARAQQLDPKSRTLLLISAGAKLVQPAPQDTSVSGSVKAAGDSPSSGPWCKVNAVDAAGHPLPGQACWISRADLHGTGVRHAWRNFPLNVSAAGGEAAAWARVIHTDAAEKCAESGNKTWYRVSVADANDTQIDGWVCDHGHPLVELKSPWDWPGFDLATLSAPVSDMFQRALFIAQDGTPDEIASFEEAFNSVQSDATVKKLEDAIDRAGQHDGKITAQELKAALGKQWLADRIDHLIVKYESEWGGDMSKWDALDSHMQAGLPVWQAEKTRIDGLRFWSDVASVSGFPALPVVYHLHPIGLVGNFKSAGLKCVTCGADLTMTRQVLTTLFPRITASNAEKYSTDLTEAFKKHNVNTCARVSHFLGQASVECTDFTSFEESLVYRDGHRLWGVYHSALVAGLHRLHPTWTETEMRTYAETHLANNDAELGKVLFGNSQYPDVDYRGRGPLAVTWDTTYSAYQTESGTTVMPNPRLFATDSAIGCDSSAWFWERNGISTPADGNSLHDVTHIINKALLRMHDRGSMAKRAFTLLNGGSDPCAEKWKNGLTVANGWTQ